MNSTHWITVAVVIATLLVAVGVSGLYVWQPRGSEKCDFVRIEPDRFDLHESLRQKQLYEAAYKVTNISHRPIRLVGFETDCGCTVAKTDVGILRPGDSTIATATVDTGTKDGHFEQFCYLVWRYDDDLNEYRRPFSVHGSVVPEYDVSDTVISVDKYQPSSTRITVKQRAADVLALGYVGSTSRAVSASIVPDATDDSTWHVDVSFNPENYTETIGHERLLLSTGGKVISQLSIQVVPSSHNPATPVTVTAPLSSLSSKGATK